MAFYIIVFLLLVYGVAKYGQWRLWKYRPKRLCLSCQSVEQPNQFKNKRWYCPICQADNPIPLNSPAAVEFFNRAAR